MDTQLYQVSRDTLHDLTVCARQVVGQLKAPAMAAVVKAITEADDELARRDAIVNRTAEPVEIKE